MKSKTLDVLFHETLKDIYYAERKILRALPKMARGTQSSELRAALEKHEEETQVHVERLQQVFDVLGKPARGKTCPAIDGIIYSIQGSTGLVDFTSIDVSEVTPALSSGMPAPSTGWTYRTFRLPGSPSAPNAKAFLREHEAHVNHLVYEAVAEFGGSFSAEHGIGELKADKLAKEDSK